MGQAAQEDRVAALSPSERRNLLETSDAKGLAHLAAHLGAIVLLGAAITWQVPYWPVLILPQGILIAFLFCPLHEATHGTAFRSSRLNVITAHITGFLKLMTPRWFGFFHNAHHAFTQNPERDPELATAKPQTIGQYAYYLTGLSEWTSRIRILLTNAMGRNADPFVPDRARHKVTRQAQIYLALYIALIGLSLWTGSLALLWAWVVPALIGQPFLRAYLLAEHARCPYVADMFRNTRTTFTTRAIRLLAWNMPYHAEHHAYPNVPFHKLPMLHALVHDQLKVTENGYLNFNREYVDYLEHGGGEA